MQRSLFRVFFAVLVAVVFSGSAWASPGIDCRAQSLSRNEMAICRDAALSSAYQTMRQAYAVVLPAASAIDPGVSNRQEQWERAMLAQCADAACLQSNLANRTVQLQQALVKVNGVRQARGEPPVSAPNLYAQAPQPNRQNFPPPVDRNPYVNEAPAPAVEPPREVAVVQRTPAPTPVPAPAPVAPVEKQAPAAVVAQAAAPQASEPPPAGETPAVRKDLDPEQLKAILDAQKALLAQINANDEKIAALEAQKAAALAGQLTPASAATEPAPAAAPSTGGVAVEPPPGGTWSVLSGASKMAQGVQGGLSIVEKVWIGFLVINLLVFLYLTLTTNFKMFTNITDLKFCLIIGAAFIVSRFTESKAHPAVDLFFQILVVGILAWHTFKATPSPVVAFFLLFAKYAMVHLTFVFVLVAVFGIVAALLHVTDRNKSFLSRLAMLLAGGGTAYASVRTIKGYVAAVCQDPVSVSLSDYFKGVSSRTRPKAPAPAAASPKEPAEEPSLG